MSGFFYACCLMLTRSTHNYIGLSSDNLFGLVLKGQVICYKRKETSPFSVPLALRLTFFVVPTQVLAAPLAVGVLPLVAWKPGEVIGECSTHDASTGYVKGLDVKSHAGGVGEYMVGTLAYGD